jgi:hypothetical protein
LLLALDLETWIIAALIGGAILITSSIICFCVACSRRRQHRVTQEAVAYLNEQTVDLQMAQLQRSPRRTSNGDLVYSDLEL